MKITAPILFVLFSTTFFFVSCRQDLILDTVTKPNSPVLEIDANQNELPKDSLLFAKSPADALSDTFKSSNVGPLQSVHGKYPYQIKLLEMPALSARIVNLIGKDNFNFIKAIRQVETPIEVEDGTFYSWAMEAHSGGDPSAVIMIDFTNDILHIGIRRNQRNQFFSERQMELPEKMKEWSHQLRSTSGIE